MSRKLGLGLAIGLVAAMAAAWVVLDRQVERLDSALGRQLERVEKLDAVVGDANGQIEQSYQRMEQARRRRGSALRELTEAESEAVVAEEERAEAETLSAEAAALEQRAREQAEEARRRAEAERRKREEEWSRLERALNKIAPTRRYGWSLTVELPAGLARDKEKISRLAGILLAHHGYRATVVGEGAAGVEEYLNGAGIPGDVLARGASAGSLQLTLSDQILGPQRN